MMVMLYQRSRQTEKQAIQALYDAVAAYTDIAYSGGHTNSPITVVGHNVAGFDLPSWNTAQ